MKTFCLKIKKYALITLLGLSAGSTLLCTPVEIRRVGMPTKIKQAPLSASMTNPQPPVLTDNAEVNYTADLTYKIEFLFNDAVKLLLDFVDDQNTETYGAHVEKFATKIKKLKEDIIDSIDEQLKSATGKFKDTLVIARDLVTDMLTNITKVHAVLVKHLPKKNAINLKADLEPAVKQITSTATFNRFDTKLIKLHGALADAGHTQTAGKIAQVRTELKKAKANYDAQKVSAKMLGILRRRLRRK